MARVTLGGDIGDFLQRAGADLPGLVMSLEQMKAQRRAREDRIARQGVLDERFDLVQSQRREDKISAADRQIREASEAGEETRRKERRSDERFERTAAISEGNLAERRRSNIARENQPSKSKPRSNLVAKARKDLDKAQTEQAKRRKAFEETNRPQIFDPATNQMVPNPKQFDEQPITIKDIFKRDLQHFLPGDPKFGPRGTDSIAGILGIDDAMDQFGRDKYPDWDDLTPAEKKRMAELGWPDK